MPESTKPVLTYFDGPGRGELSRLCFKAGDVDFEDNRIQMAEWPAMKFDAKYTHSDLFNQLPTMKHGNDIKIGQSAAVSTYAAGLGCNSKLSPTQQATEMMYVMVHAELQAILYKCLFGSDESRAAGKEALPGATKAVLEKVENILPGEDRFIQGGEKPTMADLAMFDVVTSRFPGLRAMGVDLTPYAKLNALVEKVCKDEKIADYVKARGF